MERTILPLQSDFFTSDLPRYLRYVLRTAAAHYTASMSSKPGVSRIVCAQCEQPEAKCWCEKFCVFCQSQVDVRLCTDGLMYCEACRTACEYKTVD